MDQNGRSPLFLVCYKGYSGLPIDEQFDSQKEKTMIKRQKCVQILIKEGADVNFATPKINMTPLHWAAYQNDNLMVELLLKEGARLRTSKLGDTPVDVAGFCGKEDIVMIFLRDLELRITERINLFKSVGS